ncbi:Uncharacterized protein Adt_03028 [Abeliophyllum distichum]|uniref:Retrotransposon gag domain-containing protein n=1 Tax=Abeliophyllum distichum TaxID=126358 RepID=A0ABD1VXP4_9LAMI
MNVPLPLKFKEPIGDFDGTTYPIDHIQALQDWVRLHGWPDAIACRAFLMMLQKDAREWFDTLSPRLISSFLNFANKFAISFSSSARKKKTAMGLMQPSVIIALLSGLRNQIFRASLSKKLFESMTELFRRGDEYIDQEKVMKATRSDRDIYDRRNKKRRREEPSLSKQNTHGAAEYRYRPMAKAVNAITQI